MSQVARRCPVPGRASAPRTCRAAGHRPGHLYRYWTVETSCRAQVSLVRGSIPRAPCDRRVARLAKFGQQCLVEVSERAFEVAEVKRHDVEDARAAVTSKTVRRDLVTHVWAASPVVIWPARLRIRVKFLAAGALWVVVTGVVAGVASNRSQPLDRGLVSLVWDGQCRACGIA